MVNVKTRHRNSVRFISIVLAALLAVFVSFFCACFFSLGVEDMTEYNSRFPNVYSVKWDFSYTKTDMSEFVGEEDFGSSGSSSSSSSSSESSTGTSSSSESSTSGSSSKSDLVAVVDKAAYRAIAIEANSDSGTYASTTVSELALYLYYEGEEDASLNYGIFVSSSRPDEDQDTYTMKDITDSSVSGQYTDGAVESSLSSGDMLVSNTATLTKGWSSIYLKFSKITVNAGQYLVIVFFENNDYKVSATESTTTDSGGNIQTTYNYTFTQYTDNDVQFSFDKVLLYVNESDSTSSSGSGS